MIYAVNVLMSLRRSGSQARWKVRGLMPEQIVDAQRACKRLAAEVTEAGHSVLNLLRTSLRGALLALFFAIVASSSAAAHSGGLNAAGCHNDRKNGGYHCHRAPVREALPFQQSSTDSAYYPNCAAARAAGAERSHRCLRGRGSAASGLLSRTACCASPGALAACI